VAGHTRGDRSMAWRERRLGVMEGSCALPVSRRIPVRHQGFFDLSSGIFSRWHNENVAEDMAVGIGRKKSDASSGAQHRI